MNALLLIFHGSRDPEGNSGVEEVMRQVEILHGGPVFAAHLEFASPPIPAAIDELATLGYREIVLIPVFLGAAGHVKRDIPRMIAKARLRHPDVQLSIAPHLGVNAAVLEILAERRIEAERCFAPGDVKRTSVILAARGSSDRGANAEMNCVAACFQKEHGLLSTHAAFLGLAHPNIEESVQLAAKAVPRRIVVVPVLLFPGILQSNLEGGVREARRAWPEIEFTVAEPIGPDPRLAAALLERLAEYRKTPAADYSEAGALMDEIRSASGA